MRTSEKTHYGHKRIFIKPWTMLNVQKTLSTQWSLFLLSSFLSLYCFLCLKIDIVLLSNLGGRKPTLIAERRTHANGLTYLYTDSMGLSRLILLCSFHFQKEKKKQLTSNNFFPLIFLFWSFCCLGVLPTFLVYLTFLVLISFLVLFRCVSASL